MRSPALRPGTKASKRSAARLAAVQALYQMDIAQTNLPDLLAEYRAWRLGAELEGAQYNEADRDFFEHVVSGVVREQRALDPRIDATLAPEWPLRRLDAILRAILRAGAYELMFRPDVPARAVISEYVDVASAFFEGDEPRFANGVLDRLARDTRAEEFGA